MNFVYVMENESLPNLLKIGRSTRHPNERAKELSSSTSTPTSFKLIYFECFEDDRLLEKNVHKALHPFRYSKEFFEVDKKMAVITIKKEKLLLLGKDISDIEILDCNFDVSSVASKRAQARQKKKTTETEKLIPEGRAEAMFCLKNGWFRSRRKMGLPVPPEQEKEERKKPGLFWRRYDPELLAFWFSSDPESMDWDPNERALQCD
jgi:hypothetical protein